MKKGVKRFQKWTLPSKASFLGLVLGVPLTLVFGLIEVPKVVFGKSIYEENTNSEISYDLNIQTNHELSYSYHWIKSAAEARKKETKIPIGSLKTNGLNAVVQSSYPELISKAYGEQDKIYSMILFYSDIAKKYDFSSAKEIQRFEVEADCTFDDVYFLTGFIFWYHSKFVEQLEERKNSRNNHAKFAIIPAPDRIYLDSEIEYHFLCFPEVKESDYFVHFLGYLD